jgi:hypothetical protein
MLDTLFNKNFYIYLLLKLTRSWEPEPKVQYTGSSSGQKFQLLAAPAVQHWKLTANIVATGFKLFAFCPAKMSTLTSFQTN